MASVYDFTVQDIHGQSVSLADYRDSVLLIVNTASKCGLTPQYAGLEELYERFRGQGFSVLAFPCDQFGHQEPGDSQQIETFCTTRFSVKFPIFEKLDVNGDKAAPLFRYLKSAAPGLFGTQRIKWNFTKFLISRDGSSVRRFAPKTKPESLVAEVERRVAVPRMVSTPAEQPSAR
jgi:glutathione peroxidase